MHLKSLKLNSWYNVNFCLLAGLKKCLIGGGVGLAISAVWAAWMLSGGSSKKFNDFKNYI